MKAWLDMRAEDFDLTLLGCPDDCASQCIPCREQMNRENGIPESMPYFEARDLIARRVFSKRSSQGA